MVIDGQGRGGVAAPEARDVANRYCILSTAGTGLIEGLSHQAGAPQVAGHVGADPNVNFWWWLEIEVRVKTGDCVDLADRYFQLPGQLVQLIGGQISERSLDGPKFVKHTDLLAFAVPEPSLENGSHDTKSIRVCPLNDQGTLGTQGTLDKKKIVGGGGKIGDL